ncbi:hypothetical protein MBGDN05_00243 [Thermoplasmatales archaeon SCGC AB-539-N05]|nr:hypothetical protein MBGDN05_00243 [Thermoplasmatales archaeon SCGC AB-539-N05]
MMKKIVFAGFCVAIVLLMPFTAATVQINPYKIKIVKSPENQTQIGTKKTNELPTDASDLFDLIQRLIDRIRESLSNPSDDRNGDEETKPTNRPQIMIRLSSDELDQLEEAIAEIENPLLRIKIERIAGSCIYGDEFDLAGLDDMAIELIEYISPPNNDTPDDILELIQWLIDIAIKCIKEGIPETILYVYNNTIGYISKLIEKTIGDLGAFEENFTTFLNNSEFINLINVVISFVIVVVDGFELIDRITSLGEDIKEEIKRGIDGLVMGTLNTVITEAWDVFLEGRAGYVGQCTFYISNLAMQLITLTDEIIRHAERYVPTRDAFLDLTWAFERFLLILSPQYSEGFGDKLTALIDVGTKLVAFLGFVQEWKDDLTDGSLRYTLSAMIETIDAFSEYIDKDQQNPPWTRPILIHGPVRNADGEVNVSCHSDYGIIDGNSGEYSINYSSEPWVLNQCEVTATVIESDRSLTEERPAFPAGEIYLKIIFSSQKSPDLLLC